MICHGSLHAAPAVSPLAVPVIEPAFGTLLVAAIGTAPLLAPGLLPAGNAAVALSAIAAGAEEEDCVAVGTEAKPLPQHHFVEGRHPS